MPSPMLVPFAARPSGLRQPFADIRKVCSGPSSCQSMSVVKPKADVERVCIGAFSFSWANDNLRLHLEAGNFSSSRSNPFQQLSRWPKMSLALFVANALGLVTVG